MSSTTRLLRTVKQSQMDWTEVQRKIKAAQTNDLNWEICVSPPLKDVLTNNAATAICNPELVLGPMLTAAASLIHFNSCIELRKGWNEPPILWLLVSYCRSYHKYTCY